ncbi:MAG: hypothetical protein IID09_07065 [Candidatus Hydrogenedentes bacterium]|nr:hypothetical protein [Candidatus Hydrogenedentota bacterium]
MDPTTIALGADSGGYWSGLIVPALIVIVGLLTATVVLLVTRERAVSSGPQAGPEPPVTRDVTPDAPPEGPGEDE